MYCKSCGNQLPDGSVKCHYCGTQQTQNSPDNNSPYETGQKTVTFNPPPSGKPKKKGSKGVLIGVVIAVCVVVLAALFIFVIKPKIDEKKNPNSDETTASITTTLPSSENVTDSENDEETRTGNAEKTTRRESETKKEKTSKKSESEKTNTNNKVENPDKNKDDSNASTLPPQIDTNPQYTKLEESYAILDDILWTIEWGSDAEVDQILKNDVGLVYSDPDEKFLADVIKSTTPYFTYKIIGYEQLDENTYDFYIDIYTVDFYDVADAFANEVLAYTEELYWYGDEPTDEEIQDQLTQFYLDAFDYNDHNSVVTETYITMTYVNGTWEIDSVDDIFMAMLCDYEDSWTYADQIIQEGLTELDEYYNGENIVYDDPYDVYA